MKEFGKLDILVNNAAFQEHVNKFEDLTDEHFDRTHQDQPLRLLLHGARRPCRT